MTDRERNGATSASTNGCCEHGQRDRLRPPGQRHQHAGSRVDGPIWLDQPQRGDVFREEAKRRGMSLGDFGELCKNELDVDRSLDELLRQRMQGPDAANIVESRLAGWWAYRLELPCLRIWLDVSDEERARRVSEREGLTLENALEANRARAGVDGERFLLLYDLVPEDPEPYTHVLDATTLNASQILDHVVALLEEAP